MPTVLPPLPPTIRTISEILIDLNGTGGKTDWVQMPGYYFLSTVDLTAGIVNIQGDKGLILVSFANSATSEIRTYIAKFLDVPPRDRRILYS